MGQKERQTFKVLESIVDLPELVGAQIVRPLPLSLYKVFTLPDKRRLELGWETGRKRGVGERRLPLELLAIVHSYKASCETHIFL